MRRLWPICKQVEDTELHLTREITRKLLSIVRDAVFESASELHSRSTYRSFEIRKTDSRLELIMPLSMGFTSKGSYKCRGTIVW
jgi:hypothetical protein